MLRLRSLGHSDAGDGNAYRGAQAALEKSAGRDDTEARKIYPATPGPRNCLRTSENTRACEKCGCTPAVLHTPIRAAGRFCAECCPHCSLPFGTPSGRLEAKP